MTLPHAFHDLPAEWFPVTMTFYNRAGEVVYEVEVVEPAAVHIPALAKTHGRVTVEVHFGDGSWIDRDDVLHEAGS